AELPQELLVMLPPPRIDLECVPLATRESLPHAHPRNAGAAGRSNGGDGLRKLRTVVEHEPRRLRRPFPGGTGGALSILHPLRPATVSSAAGAVSSPSVPPRFGCRSEATIVGGRVARSLPRPLASRLADAGVVRESTSDSCPSLAARRSGSGAEESAAGNAREPV